MSQWVILPVAWRIFLASDYDAGLDLTVTPDGTNHQANIDFYENTFTFERLAKFQSFNATHTQNDEQTTTFDDCDESSTTSSRLTPQFNFDLFGVNNLPLMAQMINAQLQTTPAAPVVGATQVFPAGTSYDSFRAINGQNANGTAPTITSLVEDGTAYALVDGTDYEVVQDGSTYGLVFLNSGNYDLTTNLVTLTYDYTPAANQILSYESTARIRPLNLLKFVSCEQVFTESGQTKRIVRTLYVNKAFLDSDYVEAFVDLANGELEASSLTFTGEKWSVYTHKKEEFII